LDQGDPQSFLPFDDQSPTVSTVSGVRRDGPGNDERETKLAAMSPRILRAVTIENFGNEGRQRLQEIGSLPPPPAHHSPGAASQRRRAAPVSRSEIIDVPGYLARR